MQPPSEDGPGAVEAPPDQPFDPGAEFRPSEPDEEGTERVTKLARGSADSAPVAVDSNGDPAAFDPGIETGYLRRAPRLEPPPVELGARPFDPGPEIGFDQRRAKRLQRRREREETARREVEEAARLEAERGRREAEEQRRLAAERARREAAEGARVEAEQARRDAEERHRLSAEREARQVEEARRSRSEQRERLEAEERKRRVAAERVAQAREEARKRALREQRKEERRERRDDRRAAVRRLGSQIRSRGSDAGTRLVMAGGRARQLPPRRLRSIRRGKHPAPRTRARSVRTVEPGLARPTAKASATIAAVAVAAGLAGSALGLPLPFESSNRSAAISLSASGIALPVDSGIAAALYRGPFHPVLGNYDYGESGAEFGAGRGGRSHEGQDIFSKSGTPLIAVRDGIVVDRAGANGAYAGGRGNYIAIYSPIENRSYVYLHLLKPAPVAKGDRVHAGQIIGLMGCTGSCYGTHLHFEVRKGRATFRSDTKAIDPLPFLRELPQAPERLTK